MAAITVCAADQSCAAMCRACRNGRRRPVPGLALAQSAVPGLPGEAGVGCAEPQGHRAADPRSRTQPGGRRQDRRLGHSALSSLGAVADDAAGQARSPTGPVIP